MKAAVISSYACIRTSNNYGALMQYYALQEYLKSRGHEAFWIKSIIPQRGIRVLLRHVKNYKSLRLIKRYHDCHKSFYEFVDKYLNVSSREFKGNDDLIQNIPEADFYITGSDQVWGGELKENYLLFVPESRQKIAYAASFGRDKIDERQMKVIAPWIKDIPYVSVREASGVEICRQIGVDSEHLLDPTLLIDAQKYPSAGEFGNDRIFCYFLNVVSKADLGIEQIRRIAEDESLDLRIASCQYSEKYFDDKELITPSPEEWLTNYKKARYVVTNTFHGTAFAIIFRKPFATILQTGESSSQNTRMLSLLVMFGLENRISSADTLKDVLNTPIDWVKVEALQNGYREKTDAFFSRIGL